MLTAKLATAAACSSSSLGSSPNLPLQSLLYPHRYSEVGSSDTSARAQVPNHLPGMTTFLFTSVAVSGLAIIAKGVPLNRRNRFILTAGLVFGYGASLVPTYFDNVFTYSGDNGGLRAFLDAISLIMSTGYAITAVICMGLNFLLPEEVEDVEGEMVHSAADHDSEDGKGAPHGSSKEV